MKIVWDEPKRLGNVEKHGFDFADLTEDYFYGAVVRPARPPRWFAFGQLNGLTMAVIFSRLGMEAVSIISMRSASDQERMEYGQSKRV